MTPAPADGYIVVSKRGTANNQYIAIYSSGLSDIVTFASGNGAEACVHKPVFSGESFVVAYNVAGKTEMSRFYYCFGSEPTA